MKATWAASALFEDHTIMAEPIDPDWAWQPYEPSKKDPWDLRKVGHLYRRAAFGATLDELQAGVKAGPEKLVDDLMKGQPGQDAFDHDAAQESRSIAQFNNDGLLAPWWLYRILYGQHPLREKMAIFWHNHFATSNAKVKNAGLMLGQYRLIHDQALGNFRKLLEDISTDPAMLVWLDGRESKKGSPNENYARELMELFSLGIGNYTEQDVREAARAFTGWEIADSKGVFNASQHDDTEKEVLGKKGKLQGKDIVDICLEQASAAPFVVGKLYRCLVSETVPADNELLAPLARQLRKSDYDFGDLVRTVLRSNFFFSPSAYRSRIKPPVAFAMGIIRPYRALEEGDPQHRKGRIGTVSLAAALQGLGQDLFHPPSVKGWDGGQTWLNGQTLLFRQNLALGLTSTLDTRFGDRIDPADLAQKHGKHGDEELVDFFLELYLQGDVPDEARAELLGYLKRARPDRLPAYFSDEDKSRHRVRALCHLVLSLPEFQLE
jgi:uncharacterized protein (DUF1800 family)